MSWNEEEHPRDEDGRFTYKNGGSSTSHMSREEIAHTLYSDTRRQKEEKEIIQRRRNELLNILGDKATNTDILYGTPEKLEKRIKEEGLGRGLLTGGAVNINAKNPYMTPMKDYTSRHEYLKQNMTKLDDKIIPGYNASSLERIDNREMKPKTYAKLRELLQMKEGFVANAYQDTGGVWTIGYGHTKNVKPGDKITREQAERLFEEDIKTHIDSLKHVKVPLTENQKAALGSLIFNTGGTRFYHSKMLQKLNKNDIKGAADEFDDWDKDSKNKQQDGLDSRRKVEKRLFLTPDE